MNVENELSFHKNDQKHDKRTELLLYITYVLTDERTESKKSVKRCLLANNQTPRPKTTWYMYYTWYVLTSLFPWP